MPAHRTNLAQKIKETLKHVTPLPPEAKAPLTHYERAIADAWALLDYIERVFKRVPTLHSQVVQKHLVQLHGMLLINLIEAFERFLKEIAAVCIDHIGAYVLDDRFNAFRVSGSVLAAHYATDTLGKALCESSTWLDTDDINDRFRKLLANPFEQGAFTLFPKQPATDRERYETLALIWQIRHTVVHNVGIVTQSDAIKFRLPIKEPVETPRLLAPQRDDLRYLKRFLDETAKICNDRIGRRLTELLSALHTADSTLFAANEMAERLAEIFGIALMVAGQIGTPPP